MSRTSYGYIAYKIPSKEGATNQEVVDSAQSCVQEMVAVLTRYGGSLCTLKDVFSRAVSDAPRIAEMSTAEAVQGKKPESTTEKG